MSRATNGFTATAELTPGDLVAIGDRGVTVGTVTTHTLQGAAHITIAGHDSTGRPVAATMPADSRLLLIRGASTSQLPIERTAP